MNQTRPNSNDYVLNSMIKESIHRFLTEYKKGKTDFSNFTSIFSRFLISPDPQLEIIWFYSALILHTAKFTTQNRVLMTKDLFQLLVSCSSSSCNAVKRIAVIAPVIQEIFSLVSKSKKEWIEDIENLLEVIVSYISICFGSNFQENNQVRVLESCFVDLVRVWVVDKIGESCQLSEAFRVFFPLVNDGIHERFASEGSEIGIGYLAGIVMTQVLLLSLYVKFESSRVSRVELEKELRDWTVQTTNAFPSYDFFDTILRMLLEPVLPIISLLNPEGEVMLREILFDIAMTTEFSCLGPSKGIHLPDRRLKNLAITWLFVADNGIRFLRENDDQTKVICYVQAFSESCLPSKLMKWVTNQPGIQNTSTPKISTPLALIRWLLIVEDQGVRVFDSDISKIYAKTIICKSRIEYGVFKIKSDRKNLCENDLCFGCNEDEGEDKVDGDLEMVESEDTMLLAAPKMLKVKATNGTRKRKEERKDEGDKQIKFVKCHLREKVSQLDDYDSLSCRSEVDNLTSDGNIVFMEH